ncbi:hypothetical protein [Gottfriedia endophytica]|nr:hypothetical protein [Gottfriedia endophytica]
MCAMMLDWDDAGIHYSLAFYSKQSGKKISKNALFSTAKSFE